MRLSEHAAADTRVLQQTIDALVAAHGDVRDRIDPQPWGLAAAQAAIKQFDLGRNFGEQRIKRLVEKFETRDFRIAQVDHDARALGRLDARLMHRLFQR